MLWVRYHVRVGVSVCVWGDGCNAFECLEMLENISAFALVSWLFCCLAWAGVCEPVREYVRTAYGQTHPGG